MMFHDKLRKPTIVVASALAMTLGATAALAQTTPAPAGGPPMHGHRPHGDMIGHLIVSAKAQLNLNTSQQQMWDAAVAQSKSARATGRASFEKVRSAMSTELAKTEPDLASVAAAADDAKATNEALRKQVRAQWLALYATFSADQKAVVKTAIQSRMAKADQMREQFQQKMQQRQQSQQSQQSN